MALFPGQPTLLDDFNRADQDPLSLNPNWSKRTTDVSELQVLGNECHPASNIGIARDYWNPNRWGGKVAVAAKVTGFLPFGSPGYYLWACFGPGGAAGSPSYECVLIPTSGFDSHPTLTQIQLRRNGSIYGGGWFHNCDLSAAPSHVFFGDQFGLYVNDRSIEAWYDDSGAGTNWTFIDSVDDSVASGGADALPENYAAMGMAVGFGEIEDQAMDDFCAEGETPLPPTGPWIKTRPRQRLVVSS